MAETESKTPTYDALDGREQALVDEYLRNGMVQWTAYRDTVGRSENYNVLRVESSKRFANPNIKTAIQERLAENRMSADEVLARYREQASGSGGAFTSFKTIQVQEPRWVPVEEAIEEAQFEVDVERETQRIMEVEDDKKLQELEAKVVRLEVIASRDPGRLIKIDGPVREVEHPYIDVAKMRDEQKLHLLKSLKEDKDGSIKVEMYDAKSALDSIAKALGLFGAKGTEDDPIHTQNRVTEIRIITGDGET